MKGMEKVGYTLHGKKTKVLRKSRRADGGRKSWREGLSENKGMLKKEEIRRKNWQHERTLKPPSSTIHGGEGEGRVRGRHGQKILEIFSSGLFTEALSACSSVF